MLAHPNYSSNPGSLRSQPSGFQGANPNPDEELSDPSDIDSESDAESLAASPSNSKAQDFGVVEGAMKGNFPLSKLSRFATLDFFSNAAV